ncbi:MAG: sulfotransferase, partial [Alphaproteobacteria bacterium]|nr:sulfotransferase [Alphaproteobacteria bacterium]
NPGHVEALCNQGAVLKTAGRPAEALASYERALALKPGHAPAFNGRGALLLDANRYQEALAAYDAALAAEPDFLVARCNRARTLQFLGRFDEARADLLHAMTLAPERSATYLDYTESVTIMPGDPLPAKMEALLQTTQDETARLELHFALGKAYADLGEPRHSFEHLLKANALKRARTPYDEAAAMAFFDRIEQIFTPALLTAKANMGNASKRPIFIIGMMRSGSTLVEQILASHPAVHGAGELPAFTRLAPPGYPDNVPGLESAALQELARAYLSELERLAPGAARVTDKMPANFFWTGLIHLAFPNAAIIHTRRDAVDTCVSCFSKLFTEDHPYTYDLGELGRFYRRYEKLMAHWHRVLPPGRILDVRYEDVVAELEIQTHRIIAHCGLEWDERCLSFHTNKRPVRTASVAQVRRPLYGSAVGRARAYEEFLGPLKAALADA